jgi:hypothetical protein
MKDSYEQLAPNSTGGGSDSYGEGADGMKIGRHAMPNTRMNSYVTNMYSGPGEHKGGVKIKGKGEHRKQEDEVGNDYGT